MRGHRWGAQALAVAVVLLAAAGCGGPRGFYESGPPRVPAGGNFTLKPGGEAVVYGVRAKRCGMEPPTFETAVGEMFAGEGSQAPEVGEVYDAGIGQRNSVPCGGSVPVRAIGWRAPETFEGEVTMVFYGVDQANVTVTRPPEPQPEEEEVVEEEVTEEEVIEETVTEEGVTTEEVIQEEVIETAPEPAEEPLPPEVEPAPVTNVETESLETEENLPEEGPQADEGPIRDDEIGPPADAVRGRELWD